MGLDQLEPLVRKGGGVDGDLRAHRPRRVGESVLDPDRVELVPGSATERAAGCRQHELGHRVGITALEALEQRRMLAVDGQQQSAAAPVGGDGELAGRHEAFLVGERERDAALERPERCLDTREADDRIQDDIGLARVEQCRRGASHLQVIHAVRCAERIERMAAGHQRAQLEIRAGGNDVDRLAADRARGSEESDACHPLQGA